MENNKVCYITKGFDFSKHLEAKQGNNKNKVTIRNQRISGFFWIALQETPEITVNWVVLPVFAIFALKWGKFGLQA